MTNSLYLVPKSNSKSNSKSNPKSNSKPRKTTVGKQLAKEQFSYHKHSSAIEQQPLSRLSKNFSQDLPQSSSKEPFRDFYQGPSKKQPKLPTSLLLWQHSELRDITSLPEELQDRLLILRNHQDVCDMSHNPQVISYSAHQDFLRQLGQIRPNYFAAALYCEPVKQLAIQQSNTERCMASLEPVVGIVSLDLREADFPLIGLYKNLYHYSNIKLGQTLLFAAMLHAAQRGPNNQDEIHLECFERNQAMCLLARRAGFEQEPLRRGLSELRGKILSFRRHLSSTEMLLEQFPDFAASDTAQDTLRRTTLGKLYARRPSKSI